MKKIITSLDNSMNELFTLESILILTKESCQEKEFCSVYYGLSNELKSNLSEERNHYINMLTIALDKISNIKRNIILAENDICYLK